MIDLAYLFGLSALIWSVIQQYQINQMCSKCPFLPKNKVKNDIDVKVDA